MPVGYKHNQAFYKYAHNKFGVSHKGVHWSTKYNQYIRFDVLTECMAQDIQSSTLIDAGCGFGEYYAFLQQNETLPKSYVGIDCEKRMIHESKQRFPALHFEVKNILEDDLEYVDYYVASGTLNILNEEEFFHFIFRCFLHSKKGFAFNFLIKDSFNNISKQEVIAYCKTLTPHVQIKELYLYNDMTIFMQK